ncbi:uncharacterized protein BDR25DRAFT_300179 [Lindgomyces ingoldianus]|uniref:Uncharacterized protein n=1 Tax=Lindgomyces ingoldianus TaxID=673940 RepID=A0ACB6RDB6_9PLEO|nr:uncharacterized protein BDR25DRAFT_300179 [Lindgomyces ingoldianus]KAF2477131.1 hypothetical protein BDR25DRAFT_300179 [Lindgomyces ingoldianus]
MFEVLRISGWKPLWMRGSKQGETWFLGERAILVNFLGKEYTPQVAPSNKFPEPTHSESTTRTLSEDEYTAVGIGLVDRDAIEQVDLPYIGQYGSQYRFDVSVTCTDIENLVATSFLLRERRLRKASRGSTRPRSTTNGNGSASPRPSISTDAEGSNGVHKQRQVDSEDDKYLRPRSTSNVESRNSQDEREAGTDGKKKHRKKRYI